MAPGAGIMLEVVTGGDQNNNKCDNHAGIRGLLLSIRGRGLLAQGGIHIKDICRNKQ